MLRKVGKWTFFNFVLSVLLIFVLISNATTLKKCLKEKRENFMQATEDPQTTMQMVYTIIFYIFLLILVEQKWYSIIISKGLVQIFKKKK